MTSVTATPARKEAPASRSVLSQVAPLIGVFALATCGENNISGITGTSGVTPNFAPPGGICQSNGIGSLVRDFRIGTQQNMWQGFAAGSPCGFPWPCCWSRWWAAKSRHHPNTGAAPPGTLVPHNFAALQV